jgi:hypothetical protein
MKVKGRQKAATHEEDKSGTYTHAQQEEEAAENNKRNQTGRERVNTT